LFSYYSGISFKMLHIKTDAENIAPSLGIKVETEGIWNNFYLFCCKMKQQYTDINNQLDEKEVLFSDVYELMTWGKIPKELKLELTVPGAPRRNERLSLLPIQCSVAGVIDVKNTPDDSEQDADVAVVRLRQCVYVYTCMGNYARARVCVCVCCSGCVGDYSVCVVGWMRACMCACVCACLCVRSIM
jgi:hypothetical protein